MRDTPFSRESADGVRVMRPWVTRLLSPVFLLPNNPLRLPFLRAVRRVVGEGQHTVRFFGGRIALDERDFVQREIWAKGFYEAEVWRALAGQARGGEVFWDVGAHVGSFALRAALDPRFGRVYAVEPSDLQLRLLRHNLRLNPGPAGKVEVLPLALGDSAGTRVLFRAPGSNLGWTTLRETPGWSPREVACTTLDSLVLEGGARPPTLVKLDVEGWEERVLAGARGLLRSRPPRAIAVEVAWEGGAPAAGDGTVRLLREHGYSIRHLRRERGRTAERENVLAVLRGAG